MTAYPGLHIFALLLAHARWFSSRLPLQARRFLAGLLATGLFLVPATRSQALPGMLDDSPVGFPDNTVAASLCQPDGKILFAGGFLSHDGFATRRVARLNVDGSTDVSFVARVGNNSVDPAGNP